MKASPPVVIFSRAESDRGFQNKSLAGMISGKCDVV